MRSSCPESPCPQRIQRRTQVCREWLTAAARLGATRCLCRSEMRFGYAACEYSLINPSRTFLRRTLLRRDRRGIGLAVPTATSEPAPASVEQVRRIERVDVLGGLVHEYRHAA